MAALAQLSVVPDYQMSALPRTRSELPCWLIWMYLYGRLFRMKKTLHIDEKLLVEAREASGATTDTEAVRLGLEALVRHAAYERLRALRGTEPTAEAAPRRREKSDRKQRAA
jgi:Arc/MetJ family transcription regulator